LGDPDFVKIPVKSYWFRLHQNRMSDFIQSLKIIHNRQGKITGYESKQTTHYSIVDAQGNALCNHYSK
jgi:gamma-glutamyltranspeptidase/glutathione hydrolase